MSHNKGGKASGGAAKGKKNARGAAAEEKSEDILQAVILADSFQPRFRPFTLEKPRCLLPLANTPLIEYTLEFLDMNGVQEVFIYCGNHQEQVELYISESERWGPRSKFNPFQTLEFIRVSNAGSTGDFLRDLDKREVISGDFILVHGDVVANISLADALAKHKARREANRDACMTMILRNAGLTEHRTKEKVNQPVFINEVPTGRCIHYFEINPLDENPYMGLPAHVYTYPQFLIRGDVIDCGIDICTPDVLALWSENYDFEVPRKHFLRTILLDWELNGKQIYTEVLDEKYGARASSLQMYDSVSRDVLGRWTFPMVPDSNLVSGHSYKMDRDKVILEKPVAFSASSKVESSVIGRRTAVGDSSTITKSIIGRHCKIGRNVHIKDSYIWDNVTIDDDTTVSRSILADDAVVGKGCTIPDGSLVSYGVHIGDNISLATAQALSLYAQDGSRVSDDETLLGKGGRGAAFDVLGDGDDRDQNSMLNALIFSTAQLELPEHPPSPRGSVDDDSDSIDSQPLEVPSEDQTRSRSRLSSTASDDSAKTVSFHKDAVQGLLDALREPSSFDGAKLEFMGLRLGADASQAAMRRAVTVAFARRAAELFTPEYGGLETSKAAERTIKGTPGAVAFLTEVGVAGEPVEFVLALQKGLAGANLEAGKAGMLLAALLQQLYDADALEEEGISAWWADERSKQGGERMVTVRARCQVLVEWLEEDDEDDEEDSDED